MKIFLDLAFLILVFWLFRKGVKLLFPKKAEGLKISKESSQALTKFRNRYFVILTLLFLLIAPTCYGILFYLDQNIFISADFDGIYYGVLPQAFIQTSLLFAVLTAIVIAPFINERMQSDGLSFYLQELQEYAQGYRLRGSKLLKLSFGIILLILLLAGQMKTFFVMNPKEGRAVQGFTSDQRFKLSEIVEINNDDELQLILISGDTVFMGIFDYDSKEVSDFIKKNTP
jgi:hypothetical protein